MKVKFFTLFFLILLFSISLSAYSIEKIDTDIKVNYNGSLQISDTLLIKDVDKSEEITLPIIPVYDLKIKSVYKDLNYSYDLSNLRISVSDCCLLNNSVTLEIIYLTDFFTSKKENVWQLSYFPVFKNYVDTFFITFPENIEIVDISTDFRNVSIKDNKFYLSLDSVTSFDVNYSFSYSFQDEEKSFNWILFLIIFFIFFLASYFSFKKYFKKNKEEKEDLLLGLNENEQKIIKIVLENEGILQKSLSKECFLPKGTVSRNLKKLESKGYIEIKRYGINKKVFLGNVFSKK